MTGNFDFPSYHSLMGSLLKVTTILSHFILTLLTRPGLNMDFSAQIHYILIAMNQGLSQSGLNLNSATHTARPEHQPIRGQDCDNLTNQSRPDRALVSESSRRNICSDGRFPDTNPQTLLSFNYVKTKYLSSATTWNALFRLRYQNIYKTVFKMISLTSAEKVLGMPEIIFI